MESVEVTSIITSYLAVSIILFCSALLLGFGIWAIRDSKNYTTYPWNTEMAMALGSFTILGVLIGGFGLYYFIS